jgi:hypothetical protein
VTGFKALRKETPTAKGWGEVTDALAYTHTTSYALHARHAINPHAKGSRNQVPSRASRGPRAPGPDAVPRGVQLAAPALMPPAPRVSEVLGLEKRGPDWSLETLNAVFESEASH